MPQRTFKIVGVIAGLVAVIALIGIGSSYNGVASKIDKKYQRVSGKPGHATYTTPDQPATVVAYLETLKPKKTNPAETTTYLLYDKNIVEVVPDGTGSRITVEDVKSGYNMWGPLIIPIWGPFSSNSNSGIFRGGGSSDSGGGGGK